MLRTPGVEFNPERRVIAVFDKRLRSANDAGPVMPQFRMAGVRGAAETRVVPEKGATAGIHLTSVRCSN
jgi:hypothetical protein